MEAARGTELAEARPRFDPGDEDIGTGRGRELEEEASREVDILIARRCRGVVVREMWDGVDVLSAHSTSVAQENICYGSD